MVQNCEIRMLMLSIRLFEGSKCTKAGCNLSTTFVFFFCVFSYSRVLHLCACDVCNVSKVSDDRARNNAAGLNTSLSSRVRACVYLCVCVTFLICVCVCL